GTVPIGEPVFPRGLSVSDHDQLSHRIFLMVQRLELFRRELKGPIVLSSNYNPLGGYSGSYRGAGWAFPAKIQGTAAVPRARPNVGAAGSPYRDIPFPGILGPPRALSGRPPPRFGGIQWPRVGCPWAWTRNIHRKDWPPISRPFP